MTIHDQLMSDPLAAKLDAIRDLLASIHDDTANYPEPLDYLQALRMIELTAQAAQRDAVTHARACGESWETIARYLGTTRQAAWEKYR